MNILLIYIILIIASISRAIQEHGKWRNSKEWSILYNTWFLKTNHKYNIDGYHVSSRIFVTSIVYLGWYIGGMQSQWWLPLLLIEIMYILYGIFYHIVFTPNDKRDWSLFRNENTANTKKRL